MSESKFDIIRDDPPGVPKLSDETFIQLRDFIYARTGIFFTEKKKYFLEGRIAKRLQLLQLVSFEEYIQLLKYGHRRNEEFENLCNIITVNETSFFRNEPQLRAFYERLIWEVIATKRGRNNVSVKIWSAGCSSGEEPYSIAMIYLEYIKPKCPDVQFEIIASDINTAMLQYACDGVYGYYAMRSIPELFIKKYFDSSEGLYKIHDDVKKLVRFEYINLVDHNKVRQMNHFDFIFCANVLIYFDHKAKVQVVGDLYDCLNRGGYLFIGSSEMLHGISTAFKLVSIPRATVYKKE